MLTALNRMLFIILAISASPIWQSDAIGGEPEVKKGNDKAPRGSPDFYPSPEHPIGWRGDGTGRYPGATPPTTWFKKENGEKKNIVWETKLPCYSWSTPIIVGDNIFTRSEPYDLVCLNKNTGKILWIRSLPAFVTVTAEEKKLNPAFMEIEPLVTNLQRINDAFIVQGWTKELCKEKYDLQKQIDNLMTKIDKKYKLPPDMYCDSWSGYTATTPSSDGQNIYFNSGNGVIACYDLAGTKKWSLFESVTPVWGEHGFASSPTIVGDIFVAPSAVLHGFNKSTGSEIWQQNYPGGGTTIPFSVGGTDFVIYGWDFVRIKDGKSMLPRLGIGGGFFYDNMIYEGGSHASFYKVESKPNEGLSVTPLIAEEYNRIKITAINDPKSNAGANMAGFSTASPLYDNGLLYCLGNFGWMAVIDTKKIKQNDAIVYTNNPGFDFKLAYQRKTPGMGLCASPILAGKNIYMMDSAGCMLVVEPGREYKQVAKNDIDCTVPEWSPFGPAGYYTGPHHEQTESSPIADGNRIYIRGEQYLYCVGEK